MEKMLSREVGHEGREGGNLGLSPRYWRWDEGNWFTWDQLERGGRCDRGLVVEGRRG